MAPEHTRGYVQGTMVLVLVLAAMTPRTSIAQQVGPARGSLVLVGGNLRDPLILKRFTQLAGGADGPFVIIPTAGNASQYDEYWSGLQQFRDAGMTNVTVLHTRDRKIADTAEFVAPIRKARGVFFTGGRQWRLADSYLKTRTQVELQALLDRGGVIGGTSAGATILGSFLVRGDTKDNETMIGDHTEGFGFLKDVAIDQHVLVRNRQFDMLEVLEKYPTLLGVAIDENTAIVVQGDRFDVIGDTYVLVFDNAKVITPRGHFYFLKTGDSYDLVKREGSRPTTISVPIGRLKPAGDPETRPTR
jgi:cyanophycinase